MRRFLRLGAAVLAVAAAGCTVQTQLDTGKADAKIQAALAWFPANSEYAAPPPLARWVAQSRDLMMANAERLSAAGNDRNAYAQYDCGQKTLYLWSGANLDDQIVVSFVLHALAHHIQCQLKPGLERCAAEREATALQAKYVRALPAMMTAQGYEPDDQLLTSIEGAARGLEVRTRTECPG